MGPRKENDVEESGLTDGLVPVRVPDELASEFLNESDIQDH